MLQVAYPALPSDLRSVDVDIATVPICACVSPDAIEIAAGPPPL